MLEPASVSDRVWPLIEPVAAKLAEAVRLSCVDVTAIEPGAVKAPEIVAMSELPAMEPVASALKIPSPEKLSFPPVTDTAAGNRRPDSRAVEGVRA